MFWNITLTHLLSVSAHERQTIIATRLTDPDEPTMSREHGCHVRQACPHAAREGSNCYNISEKPQYPIALRQLTPKIRLRTARQRAVAYARRRKSTSTIVSLEKTRIRSP